MKIMVITCLISMVSTITHAAVITFEGLTNSWAPYTYTTPTAPQTLSGFDIAFLHAHYEDSSYRSDLPGSDYLMMDSNYSFDITANNGSPFSIQSFQVSEFRPQTTRQRDIVVSGQLLGGGIVNTTFTTDNFFGFETLNFDSSWTNLTSVHFSESVGVLAYDNFTLNEVPEPMTLTLLALGTGLISRRKRN